MIVWRIKNIPTRADNSQLAGHCHNFMRQILFALQNFSSLNACLELTFLHTTGEEISIYVLLRNTFNNGITSAIEMQLAASNYQFERLNTEASAALSQQMLSMASVDMKAVVKTEKIVTTPFMQEGYYYWADPLLSDESRSLDNFTMLFQTLQNCDYSFVSFQLIPTAIENYESDVLQYLNMFLEPHVRSQIPNGYGMSMYEPYAQSAYDAYRYYVNQKGQPLFLYNIVIGSSSKCSSFISNQLIAMLKAESSNAPDLQAVSVELNRYAYNHETFPIYVNSLLQQQYRDMFIWGGSIVPPNQMFRFPFLVTADEALMFFHLPYDDGKIVGISGSSYQSSNELLSKKVTDSHNVIFGRAISNQDVSIGAPATDFAKHALIVGMPGTGKTTFSINLLLQFQRKGIPFLAIEPTKAEYRAMIDVIPDLQIFTPGNNSVSPFIMNPFIPPKGIRIEKYIPSLYSAFKAAFSMPSPLDVTFLKAIRVCYNRYGWRDYSMVGDPEVTPFGFHEFILVFKQIIDNSDYSKEVKGNLRSGGVLRLSNLIEQNRNIFDTIHTIPIEDLLTKPTVIELNAIDDIEQKALIIAMLLINIAVYTKSSHTENAELNNAILIDEAHVLLDQRTSVKEDQIGSQNYAVQLVENLIAEIRSYGTSIIIADQRPSAVGSAIVANTDIKMAFRLTEKREKEIIGNSTDMDDSMVQQLSQLEKGQAYIYYHKLKKPQMVTTPNIRSDAGIRIKVSDNEIQQRNTYWEDKPRLLMPYPLCQYCCNNGCNFKLRADAEYYCNYIWDNIHGEVKDDESLRKRIYGVPVLLKNRLAKYAPDEQRTLINCIRIALQRKGAVEKGIILHDVKVKNAMLNNHDDEVMGNAF